MSGSVRYQSGAFTVTESVLKTPRRTFDLATIEYVSLRRPLFAVVCVSAAGLIGFALVFWRYLYAMEQITLIGLCAAALLIAWQFGVLRVHSLAMRDGDLGTVMGRFAQLKAVKTEIENWMESRERARSR